MYLSLYSVEHRLILRQRYIITYSLYMIAPQYTCPCTSWVHSQDAMLNRGSAGLYGSFDQGLSWRFDILIYVLSLFPPSADLRILEVLSTAYIYSVIPYAHSFHTAILDFYCPFYSPPHGWEFLFNLNYLKKIIDEWFYQGQFIKNMLIGMPPNSNICNGKEPISNNICTEIGSGKNYLLFCSFVVRF